MSGFRPKQEDKNLRIFRELLSFDNNKYCFDCNQRGPSYVNITIGSFVCTTCGGALRKYNHRVKSISMSNFSQNEMDFLKKRGNNICKKMYYGLCDSKSPPDVENNNGMLDNHLRAKYELKKWYVEPSSVLEEEAIKQNQVLFDKVEIGVPKLIKNYTINSSSNIIIEPPKHASGKLLSTKGIRTSIDIAEMPSSENSAIKNDTNVINSSKFSSGTALKLPMPNNQKTSTKQPNSDVMTNQPKQSPFGDDFQFPTPISKSQTMNFSMPPLLSVKQSTTANHASSFQGNIGGPDKYKVVADLDDLFSSAIITAHTDSSSSVPWQPWPETDMPPPRHSNPFSLATTITHHAPVSLNPFITANTTTNQQLMSAHHSSSTNYWPAQSANPFMNNDSSITSTNPFL